ncbi:hypothetical protein STEG23_002797, partial [Scotinomys teguina]
MEIYQDMENKVLNTSSDVCQIMAKDPILQQGFISITFSNRLQMLKDLAEKCQIPTMKNMVSGSSRKLKNFYLVDLSIGWNPPSSAFCRAGFVDRYCLNLVLSWNVLFTPSMFGKIFFNDFVEYVFCAFELVFFSFFYPYYSK